MKHIILTIAMLAFGSYVFAEEPIFYTDISEEYAPVIFHIDRNYIAQTYDPPRLPKVGDCVLWRVHKVDDDGQVYSVRMRLHYVQCLTQSGKAESSDVPSITDNIIQPIQTWPR